MFADENVSKQITMKGFYVPAALSLMLLSLPIAAQSVATDTILLATFNDSISLDEVVIKAHKTPRANSRWSDLQPVDLVTVGGSNGDLYRALQTLPGAQLQGESGRLLVRGGSSNETQTYIDGMHVLNPYTTTGTDTPARGRYSTFMFSGVNLASGGQSQEYGEALSAVLPLETKDYSTVNKFGMNVSTVGMGGGGTRAFNRSSLSLNLDYQNLLLMIGFILRVQILNGRIACYLVRPNFATHRMKRSFLNFMRDMTVRIFRITQISIVIFLAWVKTIYTSIQHSANVQLPIGIGLSELPTLFMIGK